MWLISINSCMNMELKPKYFLRIHAFLVLRFLLNFLISEQRNTMNQNQLRWCIIYDIFKSSCQVRDMHLVEIALSPTAYINWLPVRNTVID